MFIVLEGLDGAGKSTQIKMLREMIALRGIETEYVHFPRFDAPIYGDLIARFLRGELGSLEQVNPYIVALLYAGDRADMAAHIRQWLDADKVVIADRYVYSNIGYQCAKIEDAAERKRLKEWILHLEYEYNRIPRPDISLFLDVPFDFTVKKLTAVREGDDRDYLKGGADIHESSLSLQEQVRRVYLDAADEGNDITVIGCGDSNGAMASPELIFQRIEERIAPLLRK